MGTEFGDRKVKSGHHGMFVGAQAPPPSLKS